MEVPILKCRYEEKVHDKHATTLKPIEYYINEYGCWICISHKKAQDGYINIMRNRKHYRLHRYVFEDTNNIIIPDEYVVMHKCDNPMCFNPEHMTIGTHADNMKDRNEKHRQAIGMKNGRAKLTDKDILRIRNDNRNMSEIAKDYNIDRKQISRIKHNLAWKHIGK